MLFIERVGWRGGPSIAGSVYRSFGRGRQASSGGMEPGSPSNRDASSRERGGERGISYAGSLAGRLEVVVWDG